MDNIWHGLLDITWPYNFLNKFYKDFNYVNLIFCFIVTNSLVNNYFDTLVGSLISKLLLEHNNRRNDVT